jgi:hypothetical protein
MVERHWVALETAQPSVFEKGEAWIAGRLDCIWFGRHFSSLQWLF